jgi:hypothetical protein
MPLQQQIDTGSFIPTTSIFDVGLLYDVEVNSPEFKELLVRLYQNVNNIAIVLNTKDSAFYLTEEFNTGQVWFNPGSFDYNQARPGYREVVNVGPFGPGATVVPHSLAIDSNWKFTQIKGAASDTVNLLYYPFNYSGPNYLNAYADGTNINIDNNTGVTFTDAYIILEYLKY